MKFTFIMITSRIPFSVVKKHDKHHLNDSLTLKRLIIGVCYTVVNAAQYACTVMCILNDGDDVLLQNSISDTEGTPCDIKSNLLVARLLAQHSKEELSSEMKEQDEKKMSSLEVRMTFGECSRYATINIYF